VDRPTEARGARNAGLVSAGILLSRIAGLLRERALGHFFGASMYADAWRAALRLPNLLQNLLGEGTLSASFIPIYAGLEEEHRNDAARRFAGAVLGLLFVVAGVLVLVGIALAPLLVAVLLPGFDADQQRRVVGLVRILFPMTGVLVLSAWTLGILNTHRRFFLPYVAPVLWNLAIIGALVGGGWYLGWDGDALLRAVAWGALAGGVLQLGVQLPAALRALGGFHPSVSTRVEGVRQAIRAFLPVVTGRGVVNLGGYADLFLASFLASGAIAVLGYAQTLYMLPISLFGMAVAASELPELSRRQAGRAGREAEVATDLAESVSRGMARIAWFLVPSVLVYLALGDVVVAALYQTGAFGALEVRLTWAVLGAYAIGMGASATSRFLSSAYYALGDTATPAKVAVMRVVLALVVGASLMIPFDRLEAGAGFRYGAVGLALGSAAGAWLEFGLLRRRLRARIGRHGAGGGFLLRIAAAAVVAVLMGVASRAGVVRFLPELHPVPEAALVLGAAGIGYLGMTRALGVPGPLDAMLRRRSGGAGGAG
jgi:putative peptidoglycan lipid II flippase